MPSTNHEVSPRAPTIRAARRDEGELLRKIAADAKAHWGYEPDKVQTWASGLDFSPEVLRSRVVLVAELDSKLVGWIGADDKGEVWWLDDLWVEPDFMRQGIGAELFERVAREARAAGAVRLEWEAERNALGFYEKLGARHLRDAEPSSWGPANSIMGIDLVSA
jgi:GNAT superfamily N-acetyltransferase